MTPTSQRWTAVVLECSQCGGLAFRDRVEDHVCYGKVVARIPLDLSAVDQLRKEAQQ